MGNSVWTPEGVRIPLDQLEIALDVDLINATELAAHTNATAAHGATGAVVGTTNVQTLTNKTLSAPVIKGQAFVALTDAATIATDAALGNVFKVTLGGDHTIANPTNPTAGQTTFPSPTLSTAAGATDYVEFIYNSDAAKWDCAGVAGGF